MADDLKDYGDQSPVPANTDLQPSCEQKEISVWVSSILSGDDQVFWRIPFVTAQRKTASRDTGQEVVVDGTSVNLCSAATTTWEYQIDVFHSTVHPVENYVQDAESYDVLVVNGTDLTAGTGDEYEQFNAVYQDNGWTRDTQASGLQIRTLQFNVSNDILRVNYNNISALHDPNG